MKRDMDLTRVLMLRLEEMTIPPGATMMLMWGDPIFDVPGYTRDDAIRHFQLILDAGFIGKPKSQGADHFAFKDVTNAGHDFIAATRSPEVWSRTIKAMNNAGAFGLDLLLSVAKAEAKRFAAERLGFSP